MCGIKFEKTSRIRDLLEFLVFLLVIKLSVFLGVEQASHHLAVEFNAFGFGVFKVFSGLGFNWGSH